MPHQSNSNQSEPVLNQVLLRGKPLPDLPYAVTHGQVKIVKKLLQNPGNIDHNVRVGQQKWPLLIAAVRYGISWLLNDISSLLNVGQNRLNMKRGIEERARKTIFGLLLDAGYSPNQLCGNTRTVMEELVVMHASLFHKQCQLYLEKIGQKPFSSPQLRQCVYQLAPLIQKYSQREENGRSLPRVLPEEIRNQLPQFEMLKWLSIHHAFGLRLLLKEYQFHRRVQFSISNEDLLYINAPPLRPLEGGLNHRFERVLALFDQYCAKQWDTLFPACVIQRWFGQYFGRVHLFFPMIYQYIGGQALWQTMSVNIDTSLNKWLKGQRSLRMYIATQQVSTRALRADVLCTEEEEAIMFHCNNAAFSNEQTIDNTHYRV